ncbi:MAG: hypothetical protein N3E45_02035 [Oscillatoriaceae bacterium SKW80]|nr:hypothetical protein [Oscillatoriaceae bacterium SKYG93]MCX8119607.1 hypothetical protein [Oscillatoriaceae bacterium SKW80]MDW8455074.1 hypothetical protein [Oscillatoriaceae cyanobacterium SKYGB_i_bin93]
MMNKEAKDDEFLGKVVQALELDKVLSTTLICLKLISPKNKKL